MPKTKTARVDKPAAPFSEPGLAGPHPNFNYTARYEAAVGRGRRSLLVTSTIYDSDRITRRGLTAAPVIDRILREYDADDDHRCIWDAGRLVGLVRWRPDGTPETFDFEASDRGHMATIGD